MSDTPIAERLTAELGSPWPLRWRITGWLYEDTDPGREALNKQQREQMEALIAHRVAEGNIDGAVTMANILDGAEETPPPPDPPQ